MKKLLFSMLLVSIIGSLSAIQFEDLSDDYVIATVGKAQILKADLEAYMLGYSSVEDWNREALSAILKTMVNDLIFVNASIDENISVTNNETYFYAEYYFNKLGIDINNADAVQKYFDTSDPYYNMEDFLTKATYFLLKSKYLCKHNIITATRSAHIFFSTEKKSPKEREAIKNRAMQAGNIIIAGDTAFTAMFAQYSEDAATASKLGDIGECSHRVNNQYIPDKQVDRVIQAGLFVPIFIENSKGYSIILNTSYVLPDQERTTKLMEKLYEKYPVRINITF